MIYVYDKYQKPTPYIKRDIANVKVFTMPAGRNRHYIDSHCIACESTSQPKQLDTCPIGVFSYSKNYELLAMGPGSTILILPITRVNQHLLR